MPYMTADDYIDRAGDTETKRLTAEATAPGVINTGKVEEAIDDATNLVDSYLGARYTVPLATVPPVIVTIVYDLARERLHPNNPPEAVKARADLARKQLVDLAKGVMTLPAAPGDQPAETTPNRGTVRTSGDARPSVFNDCSLAGFGLGGRPC